MSSRKHKINVIIAFNNKFYRIEENSPLKLKMWMKMKITKLNHLQNKMTLHIQIRKKTNEVQGKKETKKMW